MEQLMNSLPTNNFKQALASGHPLIGLWCNFAFLPTVECVAHSGFDWLLLDMEHTQSNLDTISSQLIALRTSTSAAVVRVPSNDMAFIKRALDAGTTNLMIPNIRNAAEAVEAVSYTRFAPEGVRGVAGSTRGGGYTRYKDYMARANDEIALVLQIESREALDDLEAICRVPGVDAVFIGPSDLAASLGHRGNSGHPDVQAAISQAIAIGKAAGKAVGILTVDGKGEPYLKQGATMVGVGTDMHLLIAAADALAAKFAA
jgi:2-keto-3-deoxy-L-rhamnonate aldolase RhmA